MKHTHMVLSIALASQLSLSVSWAAEKIDFNSMITENSRIKEDLHENIRQNIKLVQKPTQKTTIQVVDSDESNNVYVSTDREVVSNSKVNRRAMNRQFVKKQNQKIDEEISASAL